MALRTGSHRCAVCWESMQTHDEWVSHAVEKHGAVLAEFGLDVCLEVCPGEEHARRLSNYGAQVVRKRATPSLRVIARDGTTHEQLSF